MSNAEKLQAVINTLSLLNMPPTFDNVNHMTGIYQTLVQIRDELMEAEVEADGNADTE